MSLEFTWCHFLKDSLTYLIKPPFVHCNSPCDLVTSDCNHHCEAICSNFCFWWWQWQVMMKHSWPWRKMIPFGSLKMFRYLMQKQWFENSQWSPWRKQLQQKSFNLDHPRFHNPIKPQLTKQQSTVSSLPARMAPARGSLNMITCAMKDEHLKQRNDDNFCGQRSFWRIGKNSLFFVAISICSTVSWWEGKHKAFRFWVMHGFNRSRMFIKLRWIKQHHHSTSWDSHVTHIPSQDYELLQIINELWIHKPQCQYQASAFDNQLVTAHNMKSLIWPIENTCPTTSNL